MDADEFRRRQDARILTHWQATRGTAAVRSVSPAVIDDAELERLQRDAARRADANWDENEASEWADVTPLALDDEEVPRLVKVGRTTLSDAMTAAIEMVASSVQDRRETSYRPDDYDKYLRSRHWRFMRARVLMRAGGCCQRCGEPRPHLDVHHLSYNRLGAERESDLLVLCHECHQREHGAVF